MHNPLSKCKLYNVWDVLQTNYLNDYFTSKIRTKTSKQNQIHDI